MNKKIFLPATVLALALGGVAIWALMSDHKAQPNTQLTLFGNVDIRQVSLAFNASERITELRVTEGEQVHAGDVLGRLDDKTLSLRLAQAQAQVGIQAQALLKLQAGSRAEEIAQARASLAAIEAEAVLAQKQVLRLKGVQDATGGKGVSEQDLDNALARQAIVLAQAESARNAAQLVDLGPRKEDIAQAQARLALARAEQALIQRQLDESTLRAPVDAVVRARLLEPGDMASPQRPVYTLALTQPKWVRAFVAEADLGRLTPGMSASISTDSHPGQSIPARLGYIASVAEFTPKTVQTPELRTSLVYEVRFQVDDATDQLRLGMPATVHLTLEPSTAATSSKP